MGRGSAIPLQAGIPDSYEEDRQAVKEKGAVAGPGWILLHGHAGVQIRSHVSAGRRSCHVPNACSTARERSRFRERLRRTRPQQTIWQIPRAPLNMAPTDAARVGAGDQGSASRPWTTRHLTAKRQPGLTAIRSSKTRARPRTRSSHAPNRAQPRQTRPRHAPCPPEPHPHAQERRHGGPQKNELVALDWEFGEPICRKQEKHSWGRSAFWKFVRRSLALDNMSVWTYYLSLNPMDKPLVWLGGEVKSPPLSREARLETGHWLRMLQAGHALSLPHSRPMPAIGPRCHELRIADRGSIWRIFYRVDSDAVLILEVLQKKTRMTPRATMVLCRRRAAAYDADS